MINLFCIRPKGFNVGNDAIYLGLQHFLCGAFGEVVNLISLPATAKYESHATAGLTGKTIYEINQYGHGVTVGGAILSYLVPGLGQIYQGRVGKGLLLFVCLYGMFFYGMYLGRWSNVYMVDERILGRMEVAGHQLPATLSAETTRTPDRRR